jgi:hypothetical protein
VEFLFKDLEVLIAKEKGTGIIQDKKKGKKAKHE